MAIFSSRLLNFRDLGGIKTTDGRSVKPNRLLRAAQPVELSEEDVAKLKLHNIKTIVDLRTIYEVNTDPISEIAGVTYVHIDIMGTDSAQAADPNHWMELFSSNPSGIETKFIDTYKAFATSPSAKRGYCEFLRICANLTEGALLFHCAAGKDRTGVAAALILKILGVADEAIYDDYLETLKFQNEIGSKILEAAKKRGLTNDQLEAMNVLFGVKTSYLKAALKAATDEYASFQNYVSEGLGITEREIARLKDLYLH